MAKNDAAWLDKAELVEDSAQPDWLSKAELIEEKPSTADTVAQYARVATRAALPYAAAAGVGAGVGGAVLGPPGAVLGAAGGPVALGIGDIGTSLYNVGASAFGGERIPLPSETIQNVGERFGIGGRPQTPGQQVFSDVVQAGTAGGAQALGMRNLAPFVRAPTTRNFLSYMGQQPGVQTAASMGGAAAPSVASNVLGISDPTALTALGLAGGVAGGYGGSKAINAQQSLERLGQRALNTARGTPTPTTAEIRSAAQQEYRNAANAGLVYVPEAVTGFTNTVRQDLRKAGFRPGQHPKIDDAIKAIEETTTAGQVTLEDLDIARRVASNLRMDADPNTRRLAGKLVSQLDDFVINMSPSQMFSGGVNVGTDAIKRARQLWTTAARSEEVERAIQRAEMSSGNFAEALRTQFASIARNEKRLRQFAPEEQEYIKRIAKGELDSKVLAWASKFSLGNRIQNLPGNALTLGGMGTAAFSQKPEVAMAMLGIGAGGTGANLLRNRMARSSANALSRGIRGGDVPTPFVPQVPLIYTPTIQEEMRRRGRNR